MTSDFIRRRMRSIPRWEKGLTELIADIQFPRFSMAEIGCYAGESFEVFASSGRVDRFIAIDPWVLQYHCDEVAAVDECGFVEAERAFDEAVVRHPEVEVVKLRMRSASSASLVPDGSLDLVYIDGGHDYETVLSDLLVYPAKVRPGGIIAGHDYKSGWPGVERAVGEILGRPDKIYGDTSWMKVKS